MKKQQTPPDNFENAVYIMTTITLIIFAIAIAQFLMGCSSPEKAKEPIPSAPALSLQAPLSWEGVPSRKMWSEFVFTQVEKHFAKLDLAKDAVEFCPNYDHLTKSQRMTAWSELISAISKFESGWNPKSASVDVGDPKKRDTYSIGLMQVSVVDQEWSGGGLKYTYDELLTPLPNLELGLQLIARYVGRTGLVFLPNSHRDRYFAVILKGNLYSKIPQITAMTRKLSFCK